ncbi:endonuclease [Segatella intestinalis]|uniref:endonuclease n=1 Tax=Segatella intestinalis TaxID=3035284 RepID=UPI0023EB7365|nr:endonuclease [Prevotella sp. B2-R-102]MDF4241216.1 endonuclease [Prevotella sp. B2-R-102]
MRKKLLRLSLAFLVSVMPALPMLAQIPEGYYSSLKGKKGAELKTAIWKIIKNAKVLEYGSGDQSTWWGFYVTDVTDDGYCIDRYSPRNSWQKYGRRGSSISGMNIEHSFAQSWWGKGDCNLKKDLFNIMPCEQRINSSKGNRGMGVVTKVTNTNGATKVGSGANGLSLWEPADEWKGDFARGYMYIVTAYEDYANKWTSEGKNSLYNNTYPTLKEWAYKLYIQWAKADKPDALEIKRNNDVAKIQKNRNPYVDFPNLMEYVWGDSTNTAFNPETTVKSSSYVNGEGGGGGSIDPDPNPDATEVNVYQATFTSNDGGCKENIVSNSSPNPQIWKCDPQYGWKGTAYNNGSKYEAEATLSLPEVDLTDYDDAKLTISQAVNFADSKALDYLSILVRSVEPEDGAVDISPLSDFKVKESNYWIFYDFTFDLSHYCGTKSTIFFRYTSDDNMCCTWEIKKATITGTKNSTGIKETTTEPKDFIDFSKPYDVYSIDGRKLTPSQTNANSIVIIRQNSKVIKMRIR